MSDMASFRCIIEAEMGESRLVARSVTVVDEMSLAEMAEAFGEFASVTQQFSATALSVRMTHKKKLEDEYGPGE